MKQNTRVVSVFNMSLLNRVLGVLACSRALRVYVLACSRALCAFVLTCLHAWRGYVLTCLRACVLTCLGRACVLTCLACFRAYVFGVLACVRACVVITMKCFIFLRNCTLGVWCAFFVLFALLFNT